MFTLVIAIAATAMLMGPVSAMIKSTTKIYQGIEKNVEKIVAEVELDKVADVDKLEIPDNIKNLIQKEIGQTTEGLAKKATEIITNAVFKAALFIILFIIVYIAVKIGINMLDLVTKLPLINGVNKLVGLAFGAVYGFVMLGVACLVIQMCANMDWAKAVIETINKNEILIFIYNNNILVKIFEFLL
jgi:hypothetical protein